MSDEILLSGILNFLNHSFDKFKTITKISELNDPEYIDNILRDFVMSKIIFFSI